MTDKQIQVIEAYKKSVKQPSINRERFKSKNVDINMFERTKQDLVS